MDLTQLLNAAAAAAPTTPIAPPPPAPPAGVLSGAGAPASGGDVLGLLNMAAAAAPQATAPQATAPAPAPQAPAPAPQAPAATGLEALFAAATPPMPPVPAGSAVPAAPPVTPAKASAPAAAVGAPAAPRETVAFQNPNPADLTAAPAQGGGPQLQAMRAIVANQERLQAQLDALCRHLGVPTK